MVEPSSPPLPPLPAIVDSGSPLHHRPLISWRSFYCLLTIKIHIFFYLRLRHRADHARPAPANGGHVNDTRDAALPAIRTWRSHVRVLTRFWKLSWLASASFVPASITLLQISPVLNNPISCTFAILASISALTAFVSSSIYLISSDKTRSSQTADRWVVASAEDMRHTLRSIEFWAALVLPISSIAWCLVWFMLAMFVLAWDHTNEDKPHHSVSGVVMSGLSASLLAIATAVQLWRAVKAFDLVEEG